MKKLLINLILLCIISFGFKSDSFVFKDFMTGRFTYEGEEGKVEIIRTENRQVEIYNNGKSKIILKLKWTGDSSYVLTRIGGENVEKGPLKLGNKIFTHVNKQIGKKYYCSWKAKKLSGGCVIIKLD